MLAEVGHSQLDRMRHPRCGDFFATVQHDWSNCAVHTDTLISVRWAASRGRREAHFQWLHLNICCPALCFSLQKREGQPPEAPADLTAKFGL